MNKTKPLVLLARTLRQNLLRVFVVFVLVGLIAPVYTYTREHTRVQKVQAAVGINPQINFQGKLVNPDGTNVTDGNYSIVFSIYTVASGGSNVWTETQTVAVSRGIFQVNLGSITALPGSVDFNTDNIYLGVKVGADAEMTPRIHFTSVPQAFNAERLGGLDKTGFIQNSTSLQSTSNFYIQSNNAANVTAKFRAVGSQTADIIQVRNSGDTATVFAVSPAGTITAGTWQGTAITDAFVSDTLTASIFVGSGSTTNAVDLGTAEIAGTLAAANGGTGIASYTAGDLLYASGTTTLAKLAAVASGSCLTSQGVGAAPAWSSCVSSEADTLATVTARGATTSTNVTFNGTLSATTDTTFTFSGTENLTVNSDLDAGVNLIQVTGTPSTTAGTTRGLFIQQQDSANSNGLDTGVYVNNADSDLPIGTAIQINNTGGGGYTNLISAPSFTLNGSGTITQGTWNGTALTDAFVSDTLTASILLGSGSTTNAVDLGTAEIAGTLAAANGGTGITSYTVGDLLYASGATTLSKLAAVASGSCLISQGVGAAPAWGSCASGGGITGSGANGQVTYFNGTGTVTSSANLLFNGTTLTTNALSVTNGATFNGLITANDDVTFTFSGTENLAVTSDLAGSVNLISLVGTPSATAGTVRGVFIQQADSADINGIDNGIRIDNADTDLAISSAIQIGNSGGGGYTNLIDTPSFDVSGSGAISGATGLISSGAIQFSGLTTNGFVKTTGGNGILSVSSSVALGSSDVSGTLAVGNGGTGATTFTAGSILFGNGTSAFTESGVLTNGQLLIGDGSGAPTAATLTQGSDVTITNGAGSITVAINENPTFTTSVTTPILTSSGALAINSAANGDITINANGTGTLQVSDAATFASTLTVTGSTTANGTLTANNTLTANANVNFTFSGTENLAITSDLDGTVNALQVVGTPSATAGTTRGILVQQADSANTNGLDQGIFINNADTDLVIGNAIQIANTGGGSYTNYISAPSFTLDGTGTITAGTWNGTALTDAFVSNTLTASILIGSGSTTNAVDLATAEVAGTLAVGNGGTGATTLNDLITLGTHTTGNYVANNTAGTGIAVTGSAGEGWSPTISLDYSATLAGNPALTANQSSFASTGLIFEGSTANTIETLLTVADPAGSDVTLTLPNVTGTVIGTGNISDITGLVDSQISDTLTASILIGSGSTTNAVDLGTAEVTGTLAAANGGTGLASYTVGDLLYASGATTLAKLAAVASGSCLISQGVGAAPVWGSCGLSAEADTLATVTARGATTATNVTFNGTLTATSDTTFTLAGTENVTLNSDLAGAVNVLQITGTPSATAGTARGLNIQQADSANTNGLDQGIRINNADTDLVIGNAIIIEDTGGGGYTNLINTPTFDVSGAGVITQGTWNGTALTDAFVSDTLTASILLGSGSTTNAVDLATAEVAGTLGVANGGTGATSLNDLITLGTHTTGNYVANNTAGTGIAVTGSAGEGWSPTISLDYSATLAGNPTLTASQSTFASTGLIFEGATANTIETLLIAADPAGTDVTLTLPNVTGTIIATGNISDITGLIDSQISNTLTASILIGSGSTTNAVDLGTAEVAGTLATDNGGTGIASYTVGDLLYASGTTTLAKLAAVASGSCLTSQGVGAAPAWGSCGLSAEADTLATVTARGATTSTNTTFNGTLSVTGDSTFTFAGAENLAVNSDLDAGVNLIQITGTPSATAGTTRGLFVQQQDSANTNGLDQGIFINNADTDLAITSAIQIANTGGGGYTNYITAPSFTLNGSGTITAGTWNGTALTDAFVSDTLTASILIGSGSTTNAVDLGTAEVAGTLAAANGGTGLASYTIGDLLYASGTTTLAKLAAVASGSCLTSQGVGAAPAWGSCGLSAEADTLATVTARGATTSTNTSFNGTLTATSDVTFTLAGTENFAISSDLAGGVNVLQVVGTPSATAGTTRGMLVQQADSANTNGLDVGILINNADTDLAIANAIQIANTGGGYTNYINAPSFVVNGSGTITQGTWNGTALTDAFISDTLTASILIGSGSTTNAVDLGTAEVAGTLGVANGGTGAGTFTTNGVLYGNGTSALQASSNFTFDGTNLSFTGSGTLTANATGTINLGTSTAVQTINLATGGTGAKTVTLGSTASTSSLLLQAGTGTINVQNQGTGAIGIANNAVNSTVNIGKTGATANTTAVNIATSTGAAQTVTVGSSHASSTVSLQAGAMSVQLANTGVTVQSSTNQTDAFTVRDSNGSRILRVDTNDTAQLISNPSFEVNATGWTGKGSGSVSRQTSQAYSGVASGRITTAGVAGDGISFAYTFTASTQYTLSLYARTSSGTVSTLVIGRQDQAGTDIDCLTGQTVNTSGWRRFTCTFTTGATISGSNIYIARSDAVSNSVIFVDAVRLEQAASASTYTDGDIKLGASISSALILEGPNSTNALAVNNASGTTLLNVDTTTSSVTLGADTSLATLRSATDVALTTTVTSNNKALSSGSFFRITDTDGTAKTITGFTGGTDGRTVTFINTTGSTLTLAASSASSSAGNRIYPGTGGTDLSIRNGGTLQLIYDTSADSGNGGWRTIGDGADVDCSNCATRDLNNLTTTNINAALIPNTDGTRNLGSTSNRWNHIYGQRLTLQDNISGISPVATITNSNGEDGNRDILHLDFSAEGCNSFNDTTHHFVVFQAGGNAMGGIQAMQNAGVNCDTSPHVLYDTDGADYAEYFPTDLLNKPSSYELVSFKNGSENNITERATNPNQPLIGVVSTTAGFVGNSGTCPLATVTECRKEYKEYNSLVALVGQAKVKVNNTNGAIQVGDPIGLSTTPGIGSKLVGSGYIVGYAMETLDAASGEIMVLVRPSFYTSPLGDVLQGSTLSVDGDATIGGSLSVSANLNVSGATMLNSLTVTGDATVEGNLTVVGNIETRNITVNGHIITAGDAPQVIVGTAAGQAGSVTVDGNDAAGTISVTTGSQNTANGVLASITFAEAFNGGYKVVLSASNDKAGLLRVHTVKTATGFDIVANDATSALTQYDFDYIVLGTGAQ